MASFKDGSKYGRVQHCFFSNDATEKRGRGKAVIVCGLIMAASSLTENGR
jgi:hypothetical protein